MRQECLENEDSKMEGNNLRKVMKVLIVSDTHRKQDNLEIVLEQEKPIDLLIHLGDAEGYEVYIEEMLQCPMEIVAGNNDFFSGLPKEKVIFLGKYKVLLTHGHYYDVYMGTREIVQEAMMKKYDIVMFGHTHSPLIEKNGDVIALNPGSLTYPRQKGRKPSYIVMEIHKNGEADFEIKYLEEE